MSRKVTVTRSLATLSQARPTKSFTPPYSYTLNGQPSNPSPALKPPYAHSLQKTNRPGKIAAPYKYSLVPQGFNANLDGQRVETFNIWAREKLSTKEGRTEIWTAWVNSIIDLERVKSTGNQIPQVTFRSLSEHLSSESTLNAIRSTGTIVVRDVVADAEAEQWARELFTALEERQGRATYWHDSLIAARAHPSVLSTNNQVLNALSSTDGLVYLQADTVQDGISSSGARTTSIDSPWAVDENSIAPTTPLLAHLALTSSKPGDIAPSISTAIYASLRPLFQPARSKLSFYDTSSYLDPTNWNLVDPNTIPTYSPGSTPTFPHLISASVTLPQLNPGDMILRHSSIPLTTTTSTTAAQGAFVPVTPLPRTEANARYIAEQKEAWEKGLPPPHARDEGLVALETLGSVERINSSGGKRAMGY